MTNAQPPAEQPVPDTANPGPGIALVVLDIDGVVTEGESAPLDLEFLGLLASMNQLARQDPMATPVTLCTGRPAPYLELMLQAIDGHLPGIFENGAGLYLPHEYRFLTHPQVSDNHLMAEVRQRLERGPIGEDLAFIQPGKIHTLTIFATEPDQTDQLKPWAESALGDLSSQVELTYSTFCLNILPKGIHKGKGIDFLARTTGIPASAMLGVGDSDVDIPFLQRVGYSAAPANAVAKIRAIVDYVSPERISAGVKDILKEYDLLP